MEKRTVHQRKYEIRLALRNLPDKDHSLRQDLNNKLKNLKREYEK